MLTLGSIVIQLRPDRFTDVVAFWSAALDLTPRDDPEPAWVILEPREGGGTAISLDATGSVPPDFPHTHLDLYAQDQGAEVARLLALGAQEVPDWPYPDEPHDFVVLADPDGNRFCVIAQGGE